MGKRCVVTGIGVVSPVGTGKDKFWNSLVEGKSGISRITLFDTTGLSVHVAGEVKDFDPTEYMEEYRLPMTGRYVHFAVGAARMAAEDAGFSSETVNGSRIGLVTGTTSPACDSVEENLRAIAEGESPVANPFGLAAVAPHSPSAEISHALNIFESISTITTVCTSGTNAIGMGLNAIREGHKDVVVAGATESTLAFFTFTGFIAAGLLVENSDLPPEKIMRPYDKNRSGGVLAEGAAFVVLEELGHARLRGAHIYGEVAGYALRDRIRGKGSSKQTMLWAMKQALADARTSPSEVDYICANGVSSEVLDKMETRALKELFGAYAYRLPISAIKSTIGIPNSAIGPMQLITALLAFQTDIIPPTINYETPDPECDLDYVPNTARLNRVNAALINNHALDGGAAALVAKRYDG